MTLYNSSPGKITLTDGPGKGRSFWVQRAPVFIRAVSTPKNTWDILDLVDDEPLRVEEIHVYRQESWQHVRSTHSQYSGFYYNYIHVPIDGVFKGVLRYAHRWQEWTRLAYEDL